MTMHDSHRLCFAIYSEKSETKPEQAVRWERSENVWKIVYCPVYSTEQTILAAELEDDIMVIASCIFSLSAAWIKIWLYEWSLQGSLWIFYIRDRYRTMDYPWLSMNNSILSAFQVILCIVENLENCLLIVVSLVVFTWQKSSTCPLSLSTDASKLLLYHHRLNLKDHFNQPHMRSSAMT